MLLQVTWVISYKMHNLVTPPNRWRNINDVWLAKLQKLRGRNYHSVLPGCCVACKDLTGIHSAWRNVYDDQILVRSTQSRWTIVFHEECVSARNGSALSREG